MVAQFDALRTCQPLTSSPGTPGGPAVAAAVNGAAVIGAVMGAAIRVEAFGAGPPSNWRMVEPMLWLPAAFIVARDGSGTMGSGWGAGEGAGAGAGAGAGEDAGACVVAAEGLGVGAEVG